MSGGKKKNEWEIFGCIERDVRIILETVDDGVKDGYFSSESNSQE